MESELLSKEEKEWIKNLSEERKKELFSCKVFSFGTSGIRRLTGIAPQLLNRFTYKSLSNSYGRYLLSKYVNPRVLVVHDNRESGSKYALIVANTLKELNIEVYLVPDNLVLSTPILSYYIRLLSLDGGINITASHNPQVYNGFKIYSSTGKLIGVEEEKEVSLFFNNSCLLDKRIVNKEYEFKYLPEDYIDRFFDSTKEFLLKNKYRNIRVLFSSHHGTSSRIMKLFANKLGYLDFEEYLPECTDTWLFSGEEVINPEEKESYKESIKYAEDNDYEYVCSHDPDGDRASIVERQKDGSWYFFNGNEIGVIIADYRFNNHSIDNPYVVTTNVTSDYINRILDIPIYTTKTGFKNISEVVEREENKGNNLLIAYEEASGVLLFPIHREKDGYQQIGILLEIIGRQKEKNSNLKGYLEELFSKYGYWRGFTDYYRVDLIEYLNKLTSIESLSNICEYRLMNTDWDGEILTLLLNKKSWIKFRKSGTESKLKVYYCLYGDYLEWIENQIVSLREFFGDLFKI